MLAGTIPNCVSYDPTFAHEVGVIMHHGLKRMVEKQENVFYYLTLLNENYPHAGPEGRHRRADHQGHVPAARGRGAQEDDRASTCSAAARSCAKRCAAKELLEKDWGVAADVWSCPSFNELRARRPGRRALEPAASQRASRACRSSRTSSLEQLEHAGPVIASTDYMRIFADQIRAFMPEGPRLQGARHRRLRPQRLPQQAARALRGQSPLRRRRGAEGAGRRRRGAGGQGGRGDQASTASMPTRSTRCTPERATTATETTTWHWSKSRSRTSATSRKSR